MGRQRKRVDAYGRLLPKPLLDTTYGIVAHVYQHAPDAGVLDAGITLGTLFGEFTGAAATARELLAAVGILDIGDDEKVSVHTLYRDPDESLNLHDVAEKDIWTDYYRRRAKIRSDIRHVLWLGVHLRDSFERYAAAASLDERNEINQCYNSDKK
jgi:hypothetical protein